MSLSTTVRLRHATGYLALKLGNEAREELALIPQSDWGRRDVLEGRLELHMAAKEWALVIGFGEQLARRYPDSESGWIHWAYALRELERVSQARDVLLEAEPQHGTRSAVLHYNLGCYHCLLGDIPTARERVRRACTMDAQFKATSLDDPDLAALWGPGPA